MFGRDIRFGRIGTLAVSRLVDQGVLGMTSLILAWRLGVDGFIPISALLVLNSFAIVGSNFGLTSELLRRSIGSCNRGAIRRVRVINTSITIALFTIGSFLHGEWHILIMSYGFLWSFAGEAFIRKQSLIRLGRVSRAAVGEIGSSVIFAFAVGIAILIPDHATIIVILGLLAKCAVESIIDQGWSDVLSPAGSSTWDPWLWVTGILNFGISNSDYVLVATFVSPQTFAIYSLGYRLAAMFVSQLSYVVNRVVLVDLGDSHRSNTLAATYELRRRQMFRIGFAAAVLTAGSAPLVPILIGDAWRDSMAVVLILSFAIPWRMCLGLGYGVLLAADGARTAAGWEASRLVFVLAILSFGGLFGLGPFTLAATFAAVVTATGYDRVAIRISRAQRRSPLILGAPLALGIAGLATHVVL